MEIRCGFLWQAGLSKKEMNYALEFGIKNYAPDDKEK